ncbi:hypothetical protein TrCOL_g6827 [Triparma columacea]|uniref:Uncharacterized protein n=1 Tax=Triparma columacea TaxID=722753 RepID=A0A9W7G4V5_9STRA|nr:hypothetical protein TrCOL_g6827 [Triparma columacea]
MLYFPRVRTRKTALPFLFLVPNCEHFTPVCRCLSGAGFSVLVCELKVTKPSPTPEDERWGVQGEEAGRLVAGTITAMGWGGAVVVGCGREAIAAVDAAVELGGEGGVRGLILCGDMGTLAQRGKERARGGGGTKRAAEEGAVIRRYNAKDKRGVAALVMEEIKGVKVKKGWVVDEKVVPQRVKPRFTMVGVKERERQRYLEALAEETMRVVIGGGQVGYRRLPEVFSWVLGRFVDEMDGEEREGEEESSYYEDDTSSSVTDSTDDFTDDEWGLVEAGEPGLVASPGLKDKTLGALATWLQPGSYLVLGRILANGVLYVTILTTVALQGRKCARGVVGVKNGLVELPNVIKEIGSRGGCRDLAEWWGR